MMLFCIFLYIMCSLQKVRIFFFFFTKRWLSISVTSAQKLEIVIAMVLPLKPSEGFPINPTLIDMKLKWGYRNYSLVSLQHSYEWEK